MINNQKIKFKNKMINNQKIIQNKYKNYKLSKKKKIKFNKTKMIKTNKLNSQNK